MIKFNLIEGDTHQDKYERFVEMYNQNKKWVELETEFTKVMAKKLYHEAKNNQDIMGRS